MKRNQRDRKESWDTCGPRMNMENVDVDDSRWGPAAARIKNKAGGGKHGASKTEVAILALMGVGRQWSRWRNQWVVAFVAASKRETMTDGK
jgi:hypothetical protein